MSLAENNRIAEDVGRFLRRMGMKNGYYRVHFSTDGQGQDIVELIVYDEEGATKTYYCKAMRFRELEYLKSYRCRYGFNLRYIFSIEINY